MESLNLEHSRNDREKKRRIFFAVITSEQCAQIQAFKTHLLWNSTAKQRLIPRDQGSGEPITEAGDSSGDSGYSFHGQQ
jgi:hypothetical protein